MVQYIGMPEDTLEAVNMKILELESAIASERDSGGEYSYFTKIEALSYLIPLSW